jgi:hypothetical protein
MKGKPDKVLPRVKVGDALTARQMDVLVKALHRMRPQLGFDCSGPLCICSGDDDCNDLFSSGLCGDGICFEDGQGGVVCVCMR